MAAGVGWTAAGVGWWLQVCLSQYQFGLEALAFFQYNLRAQWDII